MIEILTRLKDELEGDDYINEQESKALTDVIALAQSHSQLKEENEAMRQLLSGVHYLEFQDSSDVERNDDGRYMASVPVNRYGGTIVEFGDTAIEAIAKARARHATTLADKEK